MQKGCSAEMLPEMLISLLKRYDYVLFFFFLSFFLIIFLLTQQKSEQGIQRACFSEDNAFCVTLVNYLSTSLQLTPKALTV